MPEKSWYVVTSLMVTDGNEFIGGAFSVTFSVIIYYIGQMRLLTLELSLITKF